MKRQSGVYMVEFAIVGSIFLLLLFAIIEIGRLLYTYNVLHEASRRAARLAVVCQVDSDITNISLFKGAKLIPNLNASNLSISYRDLNGSITTGNDIDMVRAEIINYQHQFLLPGLSLFLNSPNFTTNLPRESLGVYRGGTTNCN